MYQNDWSGVYIKAKGGKKMNGTDFIFMGNASMDKEMKLNTIFIGDGSNIDGMDLKGKGVMTTASSREDIAKLAGTGAKALFLVAQDDEQFMKTIPKRLPIDPQTIP